VDGYNTFWAIFKNCLADSILLVRIHEKWDMQSYSTVETVIDGSTEDSQNP